MSNVERFENIKQLVYKVEPDFNKLAKIHGAVNFAEEASYVLQLMQDNDYLKQIAMGNPDSLMHAINNVAKVGLTLSPVRKLAYLVPRDKKICLDVSYLGYVQLALDSGGIKWVASEIVCANDEYVYQGMGREPLHKFNPFSKDRGEIIGAYCVAKTNDGEFILTQMNADEIQSIRDRSESFKSGKRSPWLTDLNEMIKKTVIRRARKSWPMTDNRNSDRLSRAIDLDPMDFMALPASSPRAIEHSNNSLETIRQLLGILGRTEEKYVEHLVRVYARDIKKLEDLTEQEFSQAIIMLNGFVEAKKAKEAVSENAG